MCSSSAGPDDDKLYTLDRSLASGVAAVASDKHRKLA